MKEKKRVLNDRIRASKVQLITDDGENLGEMSINDARIRASEAGLDLMEMGKKGDLSIVKILDYGKFLYRQKKQDRKSKAAGKAPDMKTVRITYKISDHDLEVRKNQVEKFAKIGHPIKVSLMLRGRENHYSALAREKMDIFIEMISEFYKLEGTMNKTGNTFSAILKIHK